MPVKKRSSKARKVAGFRRRLRATFQIRGTARKHFISTSKPLPARSVHTYFIDPLDKMHSREWVSRLHSTIHAAVSRGIEHGAGKGYSNYDWTLKNVSPENLPGIMVFSGRYSSQKRISGRKLFLAERSFVKHYNPTSKFAELGSYRENLEKGVVHGKSMPSFKESVLDGRTYLRDESFFPDQKKLFEVRMTANEFRTSVKNINKQLKKQGTSLQELKEMAGNAVHWEGDKGEPAVWLKAKKALGYKEWHFTPETSPRRPDVYLFYLEASRILTNKFVRKAKEWLEQNIPE